MRLLLDKFSYRLIYSRHVLNLLSTLPSSSAIPIPIPNLHPPDPVLSPSTLKHFSITITALSILITPIYISITRLTILIPLILTTITTKTSPLLLSPNPHLPHLMRPLQSLPRPLLSNHQ